MKKCEINIRDPFVLLYNDTYYMYGSRVGVQTGFDVYMSEDLENWSEPKSVFEVNDGFWGEKDFWAPEVHLYNGKFYMLATFKAEGKCRATAILVSDTPDGEFTFYADNITPLDWECLDGTLYVENGIPYMVFCHEWVQVENGEICAVELSEDLKKPVGEPFVLWRAGDAKWVKPIFDNNLVTDGPFLYRSEDGILKSLWSSFSDGYVLATAESDNGSIRGNWTVDDDFMYAKDGGHGMLFETKDGRKMVSVHSPNTEFNERPVFFEFEG